MGYVGKSTRLIEFFRKSPPGPPNYFSISIFPTASFPFQFPLTTKTACTTSVHFCSLYEYEVTTVQSYWVLELLLGYEKFTLAYIFSFHNHVCLTCIELRNGSKVVVILECYCKNANTIPVRFISINISVSIPTESHGTHGIPRLPLSYANSFASRHLALRDARSLLRNLIHNFISPRCGSKREYKKQNLTKLN